MRRVAAELADALGRRTQLPGEVLLDRRLQRREAVEAELGRQPHDRRRAGPGRLGEIGDGPEADQLGPGQDDLGDAPFGGGEARSRLADPLDDLHLGHGRKPYSAGGRRRLDTSAALSILAPMPLPPPPRRSFASDNAAGAHPAVLDALVRANDGHALAYGDDEWTARCEVAFRQLFDADVTTLLTFNGTGANVLALLSLVGPAEAVICADGAHIAVDEAGAPERIIGAKLIDLPTPDGKLVPAQIDEVVALTRGGPHHAQPGVVSITQSTELGTLYTVAEIAALCEAAHGHGLTVHLDGARLANATAALGGDVATLRAMTIDAGVDVVCFGGTKNGMVGGDAVVYLRPELTRRVHHLPQAGHATGLEDALPVRPVRGAAGGRPLARARWPGQRHGRRAVPAGRRPPRHRPGAGAGGQQPVPDPAPGRHRAVAGVELLLGLGRASPPGPMDDRHGTPPRTTSSASWPA